MNKTRLDLEPLVGNAGDVREDFELACIREFSHSGLHLGVGVSRGERRERIRAAILREGKADLRWRDSDFSYAQMYARAYRQWLGDSGIQDAGPAPQALGYGRSAMNDEFADAEEVFERDDGISA